MLTSLVERLTLLANGARPPEMPSGFVVLSVSWRGVRARSSRSERSDPRGREDDLPPPPAFGERHRVPRRLQGEGAIDHHADRPLPLPPRELFQVLRLPCWVNRQRRASPAEEREVRAGEQQGLNANKPAFPPLARTRRVERISRFSSLAQTDRRLVDHLTAEECQHLLDAPAPMTRAGIRDRTMLHVSVTAGLRVSELVGLRLDDVARAEVARAYNQLGGCGWSGCSPPAWYWKSTTRC